MHVCGAHRIGHATRLIEDESLTQYVNDRRIALEICLTSNVQTHAVESYEQHPLRSYYDRGMNVVLNTDNRLMSGTTLTDEYVHAARALDFTFDELARDRAEWIRERVPPVGGARASSSPRVAPSIARARRGAWQRDDAFGADDAQARRAIAIRARVGERAPVAAIVLGSGLGGLADEIETRSRRFRIATFPGFPPATVAGHAGALIAGTLAGKFVVALAGRFHMYEGHDVRLAAFPARVVHALGAKTLIVSNAAGGVNRLWQPGDLMLIRDHINLMFRNPLIGARRAGRRALSRHVRAVRSGALRRSRATSRGSRESRCAKASTPGCSARPTRRRPRCGCSALLGADAVGMSTVPEVIVARAIGMRVLGFSCITNLACGLSNHADHARRSARDDRRARRDAFRATSCRGVVERRDSSAAERSPRARRALRAATGARQLRARAP